MSYPSESYGTLHRENVTLMAVGIPLVLNWSYDSYARHLVQIDSIRLANPTQDLSQFLQCNNIWLAIERTILNYEAMEALR